MPETPVLRCPFPPRLHPEVELIETTSQEWAARFGLDGYSAHRFGWLAAAAYPTAPVDRVAVAADLLHWIFAQDDQYIDEPADTTPWLAARHVLWCARVVEDPDHPPVDEPVLLALDDVTGRLRQLATPAQYARFREAVTEYLMSQLALITTGGQPVTVEDYLNLRRFNAGIWPFLVLAEVAAGIDLAGDYEHPLLRRLERLTCDVIAVGNDVHSSDRENRQRRPTANLPAVFAAERQVGLDAGVRLTVDHVHGLYAEFDELAPRGRAHNPAWAVYVDGLEAWMAGYHAWAEDTSTRYRTTSETP